MTWKVELSTLTYNHHNYSTHLQSPWLQHSPTITMATASMLIQMREIAVVISTLLSDVISENIILLHDYIIT